MSTGGYVTARRRGTEKAAKTVHYAQHNDGDEGGPIGVLEMCSVCAVFHPRQLSFFLCPSFENLWQAEMPSQLYICYNGLTFIIKKEGIQCVLHLATFKRNWRKQLEGV